MIASRRAAGTREMLLTGALVIGASLLMAVAAHLKIVIGLVPVTGQTLALPLIVALIGTRASVLAMVAYLIEGACGLPVFSTLSGPAALLGPTAGYLWGYPLAAAVIGTLFAHGFGGRFATRWIAIAAGVTVAFASGFAWLAMSIGPAAAFAAGVAPFIIGDLAKWTIAAAIGDRWPSVRAALRL
jgi:biotin transporter BioY